MLPWQGQFCVRHGGHFRLGRRCRRHALFYNLREKYNESWLILLAKFTLICLLTVRASADVPGHAGSALPCPAVRTHTDTVRRGHLQLPDHHILTEQTHGNSLPCKTPPYGINRESDMNIYSRSSLDHQTAPVRQDSASQIVHFNCAILKPHNYYDLIIQNLFIKKLIINLLS